MGKSTVPRAASLENLKGTDDSMDMRHPPSQGTQVFTIHPGPISTDMGAAAGLADIAEPPSLVAEALVAAMAKGEFHVFPDSMARQIGGAYAGFAAGVIEAAGGEQSAVSSEQ